MSITLRKSVLDKYKNAHDIFIETGTYDAGAILLALQSGFSKIYSVDISTKYKDINYKLLDTYIKNNTVSLLYGDSVDVLPQIIDEIKTNSALFWLDAHADGRTDVSGKYDCPILHELEYIKNSPVNTHTILVDDIRFFRTGEEWAKDVTLEQLQKKLLEINVDYKFSYERGWVENDILVAHI